MADLGRATDVRRTLKAGLLLQSWKRAGAKHHWLGRPPSKRVNVEVIGDPVTQISVMVPIAKGAGDIIGRFLNQFAGEEARQWVAQTLLEYGDNLSEPLDRQETIGERGVRIQGLLETIIVTVTS